TQIVFTVVGLGLLLAHIGGHPLALPVAVGLVIMGSILAAFYAAQRQGVFGALAQLLVRLGRGRWGALVTGGDAIDASVSVLYRQRRTTAAASAWHLLSWLLGTGEVWLALWFLGQPVGLAEAIMLESLGQAVRAGAFAVPGALGVQEGGYVMLGRVVGLAPETALALSLAKRVRELVLGVPGLIAWQLDAAAMVADEQREARGAWARSHVRCAAAGASSSAPVGSRSSGSTTSCSSRRRSNGRVWTTSGILASASRCGGWSPTSSTKPS